MTQHLHADASALLARIQRGDREAAAAFAVSYGPLIRRRVRGKLGPQARRLFDSQDILSTVLRRLDAFVGDERLEAANERQLWQFILTVADNAVIDKLRLVARLRRAESEDGDIAQCLLAEIERGPRDSDGMDAHADAVLASAFAMLDEDVDKKILWLWLSGNSHAVTAEVVGMTPAAVRKRWQRISERLRERLSREAA